MKITLLAILAGGFLAAQASPVEDVIYPGDDGFDAQNMGDGFWAYRYVRKYEHNPTNAPMPPPAENHTPWKFTGNSGIAANGCGFYVNGATNGDHDGKKSDGGQAGFLQFNNSSISQVVFFARRDLRRFVRL